MAAVPICLSSDPVSGRGCRLEAWLHHAVHSHAVTPAHSLFICCVCVHCRLAVVILNIPLVAIGTQGYAVLSLFLVGNLLTCCAIIPLIAGLIPAFRSFITETGFVIGVAGGILGVTACGIGVTWIPGDVATSFSAGANWAWYGNNYDWRPFLASLLCSACAMVIWCAAAWVAARMFKVSGPGISGVLMRIPGMRWFTADINWTAKDVESGSPSTRSTEDGRVAWQEVAAKDNSIVAK